MITITDSAKAARGGDSNQPNDGLNAITPVSSVIWVSACCVKRRVRLGQMDTDISYHCIHQAMVPNEALAAICRSNTTKFTSAKTNNLNTKTAIAPNVLLDSHNMNKICLASGGLATNTWI